MTNVATEKKVNPLNRGKFAERLRRKGVDFEFWVHWIPVFQMATIFRDTFSRDDMRALMMARLRIEALPISYKHMADFNSIVPLAYEDLDHNTKIWVLSQQDECGNAEVMFQIGNNEVKLNKMELAKALFVPTLKLLIPQSSGSIYDIRRELGQ